MKRARLPLTALRTFEAAGRHLSFSRAADELFVSQAAVSRQIRELEDATGAKLFERLHRRVELTQAGALLLSQLTTSFDDIDRTLTEISGSTSVSTLTISVEPTFASLWLLPQFEEFGKLHPSIDISIEADQRLVEFRNSPVELAIRHSLTASSWPRVEARHLRNVSLSPVVAPSLAVSNRLDTPKDLCSLPLLHEENRDGWTSWFNAAGAPEVQPRRGPIFPDGAFSVNAARLSQGVALGDIELLTADFAAGTLVQPFGTAIPMGAYWIVTPSFAALGRPATAFVEWLQACWA